MTKTIQLTPAAVAKPVLPKTDSAGPVPPLRLSRELIATPENMDPAVRDAALSGRQRFLESPEATQMRDAHARESAEISAAHIAETSLLRQKLTQAQTAQANAAASVRNWQTAAGVGGVLALGALAWVFSRRQRADSAARRRYEEDFGSETEENEALSGMPSMPGEAMFESAYAESRNDDSRYALPDLVSASDFGKKTSLPTGAGAAGSAAAAVAPTPITEPASRRLGDLLGSAAAPTRASAPATMPTTPVKSPAPIAAATPAEAQASIFERTTKLVKEAPPATKGRMGGLLSWKSDKASFGRSTEGQASAQPAQPVRSGVAPDLTWVPQPMQDLLALNRALREWHELSQLKVAEQALLQHLQSWPNTTAWVFIELLQVYRLTDQREQFEMTAERFRGQFNRLAPSWTEAASPGKELLRYDLAITQLTQAWGNGRSKWLLEQWLVGEAFMRRIMDPQAFRDTMFLYELALETEPVAAGQATKR